MKLPVLPLSQRDIRWKTKLMGGGGSIGQFGCLLTCHSMALIYYGHDNMAPDVLNEVCKQKNIYDGNYLNFFALGGLFGDYIASEYYDCIATPCDLTKIDNSLIKKMPVIAMVDFDNNPSTKNDTHFVLIIGKTEDNHYIINDPWTGETYFFDAKYGEPTKGIYGLRLYTGTPREETNLQDKVDDLTGKLKSVNETLANALLETNSLRNQLQEQEVAEQNALDQLNKTRSERDTCLWDKDQFQAKVGLLEGQIDNKDKEIVSLKEENASLKNGLATNLTYSQLFSLAWKKWRSKK